MLEYYFCEQCEKYHEPNRLINGQYLTACECEISTQNDTLDVNNRKSIQTINLSRRTNTDTNTVNYSYDSPFISHQLQTPKNSIKQQQPIYNTRIAHSGTRYSNMPFRTIINDENNQQMKKVVITRQNDRYVSPTTIRRQIPIKRSVSPLYRVQNVSSPPPTVKTYRSIPMQSLKPQIPIKLQHRIISPIQSMQNIVYSQRTNTPIPSIKLIQNAPLIISQPQIKVLPPITTTQPNHMSVRYSDAKIPEQEQVQRISLDRVSGQPQAEQLQDSQRDFLQVEKNRFSLDRVSQNNNIIQQGEQDNECCGTLCYH